MPISRRNLLRLTAGFCTILAALAALIGRRMTVRAQNAARVERPLNLDAPLEDLNTRAQQASDGHPDKIASLVDGALQASGVFARSPLSLRDRITRAETAFQSGRQPAISETRLVQATNSMVSLTPTLETFKTSQEEIHAIRLKMNRVLPHLVGTSDAMSPLEMFYITGLLTEQKIIKAVVQQFPPVSPQTFSPRHEEHRLVVSIVTTSPEMAEIQNAFDSQLPSEWSLVTSAVHRFLDRAGLPR